MRDLFRNVMVGGLFLLAGTVFAQDDAEEEVKLGWSGVGELGYVKTTGNTDSSALNGRLEFIRQTEKWRYRFLGTVLSTSEDGTKDNERYTAEAQADRKLGAKGYVFGVYRYDADKFGSYDPSQTFTVGYGRELMKSEKHVLKGEIGAGQRVTPSLGFCWMMRGKYSQQQPGQTVCWLRRVQITPLHSGTLV
jgi:putative salt-induced outer membrane protein